MKSSKTFHCQVVTPERPVLECEASFVAFPSHDGEVGVLYNHSPLLHQMGIGLLRVETPDNQTHAFFIDSGFAQMVDNRLTLLTEEATEVDAVDASKAQAALEAALALPMGSEADVKARRKAVDRARAQLRIKSVDP
jgi:F-type H+-transporting ATPase subunit epsilon